MPYFNKYFKNQPVKIFYECWNTTLKREGTVVLINGHMRPYNDFRSLGKKLNDSGYNVLVLDNRGSGKTEFTGDFTLEDLADDVYQLITSENIVKCHVLGISMGGMIAQIIAAKYPLIVEKLILVSTSPSQKYFYPQQHEWQNSLPLIEQKLMVYFHQDFIAKNKPLFSAMVKQIYKNISDGDYLKNARQQRSATDVFEFEDQLNKITCPTLGIHGTDDQIISIKALQSFAQRIPDFQSAKLENHGHMLLAEAFADLSQQILKFLML